MPLWVKRDMGGLWELFEINHLLPPRYEGKSNGLYGKTTTGEEKFLGEFNDKEIWEIWDQIEFAINHCPNQIFYLPQIKPKENENAE